jgi:hypothetical protein
VIRFLRKNLKKLVKLTIFSPMIKERLTLISLVMLLLKVLAEELRGLEDLILRLFQISLKIFLVILMEGLLKDQTIEEMI